MSQKAYLAILIIAVLSLLSGTSHLAEGILARGFFKVNYGEILFPALLSGWAFVKARKAQQEEA